MQIPRYGLVLTWKMALTSVFMTVDSSRITVNPVIPKYCQQLCENSEICSCIYMASDLSCHAFKKMSTEGYATEDVWNTIKTYAERGLTCRNDKQMKTTGLKCGSFVDSTTKSKKTKRILQVCSGNNCTVTRADKTSGERPNCTLYKRENISCKSGKNLIPLPIKVKSGMKITVCGAYIKDLMNSQLTITMDPTRPSNMFSWLHISPHWDKDEVIITKGVSSVHYEGDFPIKNPSNFSIAVELTPNSTKIFANKVLVHTETFLEVINDVYVRRYDTVHSLMVEKSGEECNGI